MTTSPTRTAARRPPWRSLPAIALTAGLATGIGLMFTPLGSALASSTTTTGDIVGTPEPTVAGEPTTAPNPTVPAEPAAEPTVISEPTIWPSVSLEPTVSPSPSGSPMPPLPGAPSTSFSYVSAAGDKIGQGRSGTFTDSVSIQGGSHAVYVTVPVPGSASPWKIELIAGRGDRLRAGIFENVGKDLNGRSPQLDVTANGKSCKETFGDFAIHQIAYNEDNAISMLDLTFTMHCDASTAPALEGTIHLNQLPLSYRQVSEPGDPVGGGVSRTHLYSTSIIWLEESQTRPWRLQVSGSREELDARLSPPLNQEFAAGQTYQTRKTADSTHAGLDVVVRAGGQTRRCAESSGTMTIESLGRTPDGRLTARIAFVQQCAGATGALRGTLEYVHPPTWELEE
jgi:hypothetical protein